MNTELTEWMKSFNPIKIKASDTILEFRRALYSLRSIGYSYTLKFYKNGYARELMTMKNETKYGLQTAILDFIFYYDYVTIEISLEDGNE